MRIGINGPQDMLALLVRRKWWVIIPFIGLSCIVTILTSFLPKMFVSETLILVHPRDVPQDFVKDLIEGTPEQRLHVIEQTILSRTNLIQILREYGDSMPEFAKLNLDDAVLRLRSRIDISFELEKGANGKDLPLTYFRISYQNQSPELAQKIASKLTTLFIEQDNHVRESQVVGTTEFLSGQFQKISDQLNQSEEKLKQLKSSRQFELPDEREANLRTLDRLAADKKTNAEALDRYATFRLNLESQLSEASETIPRPSPAAIAATTNPLMAEYRKAELDYQDLASKYTDQYPDVQAAKAHLDHLKAQIPQDALTVNDKPASAPADSTMPNPVYQNLTRQLREVNTEYAIRERERTQIDSEIAKYSQRVESTPKVEEDLVEAQRQNDDLKKQYDDLKGHLSQAQLAENLESESKGSQFQVEDPANYPLEPTKPNRKVIALAGCVGCLAVSILLAALIDVAQQRVWTQSEIEAFWGAPVLVDIPEILTDGDQALIRRKRVVYAASSAVGTVGYALALYLVYIKHAAILQQLDPVLQKVIYK